MKKILFISALSLLCFGCSGNETPENTADNAANNAQSAVKTDGDATPDTQSEGLKVSKQGLESLQNNTFEGTGLWGLHLLGMCYEGANLYFIKSDQGETACEPSEGDRILLDKSYFEIFLTKPANETFEVQHDFVIPLIENTKGQAIKASVRYVVDHTSDKLPKETYAAKSGTIIINGITDPSRDGYLNNAPISVELKDLVFYSEPKIDIFCVSSENGEVCTCTQNGQSSPCNPQTVMAASGTEEFTYSHTFTASPCESMTYGPALDIICDNN